MSVFKFRCSGSKLVNTRSEEVSVLAVNGINVSNSKVLGQKKSENSCSTNSIANSNHEVSFGRALTTRELEDWSKVALNSTKKLLNLNHVAMIFFRNTMPSEVGQNPGIGSICTKYSRTMIKQMHKMIPFDSVQLGPHGIIPGCTLSPYSGSSFALDPKMIDVSELTEKTFGSILNKSSESLKKLFDGNEFDKNNVNLVNKDHIDKFFEPVLEDAFNGFKKLENTHPLKQEYNKFVEKHGDNWLNKDALYQAFSKENTDGEYVNDYWPNWHNDLDKNVFGSMQGTPEAAARIKEVSEKQADTIDFHKFKQFIAEKQHFSAKEDLNKSGVNVLGDCPISFAPRDQWANMNDFETDRFIGARNLDGSIQFWGGPMWKNASIIEKRFDRMNGLYDGLRADAGWEYKRSVMYTGDRQHVWDGDQGRDILDRFNASARNHGKDLTLNSLENTYGSCNVKGQLLQLNSEGYPIPEVIITGFGDFADQQIPSTWAALSTHDTPSALDFTKGDPNRVTDWFAGLFKGPSYGKGSENVLLNGTDVFGMGERLNGNKDGGLDWKIRVPAKWEEFFNGQLKNGYGFNPAEVIKKALNWKYPEHARSQEVRDAINTCDNFSRIIREDGPMTTAEADRVIDHINS